MDAKAHTHTLTTHTYDAGLGQALPAMLRAMSILTSMQGSSVFTQTPSECPDYFRYQWVTVALSVFTLALLIGLLAAGVARQVWV